MPAFPFWLLFALIAPATTPATRPVGELKSRTTIKDHLAPVRAVEFSRDGHVLISGDADGLIVLSNPFVGKLLQKIVGPKKVAVLSVSLTADGKTVVSAYADDVVRIWDAGSGDLKRRIAVGQLSTARLSPDGKLLLCARGMLPENVEDLDHVLLIDPLSGRKVGAIPVDFEYVVDACFSPDGKRIAISGGESLTEIPAEKGGKQRCRVEIWDLPNPPTTAPIEHREPSRLIGENTAQPLRSTVFSSGGKILAAASGDWLVFETAGGKQVAALPAPQFRARSCAISPNVRWVAAGALDSTIELFDTHDWQLAYKSEADPSMDVAALAFSPEGGVLAAARGRLVELFMVPER